VLITNRTRKNHIERSSLVRVRTFGVHHGVLVKLFLPHLEIANICNGSSDFGSLEKAYGRSCTKKLDECPDIVWTMLGDTITLFAERLIRGLMLNVKPMTMNWEIWMHRWTLYTRDTISEPDATPHLGTSRLSHTRRIVAAHAKAHFVSSHSRQHSS